MHILLAGDGFLLPEILQTAIGELGLDAQTTQIRNDWPVTPMVDIGGVREANGDEDVLIEALQGCEVLFTHSQPVTEKVMAASPDLKLVVVCRGGPVNVNRPPGPR